MLGWRGAVQWARLFLPAALLVLSARWAGAWADRAGLGPRNWDAGLRTAVALALPVALLPLLAGLRNRAGRPSGPLRWQVVGRTVGSAAELRSCLRATGLGGVTSVADTWLGTVFPQLLTQGARVHVFLARQSPEWAAHLREATARMSQGPEVPRVEDLPARERQLLRPERTAAKQPVCGCAVAIEYPPRGGGQDGGAENPSEEAREGGLAVLELPFVGLPSLAFAAWLPREDSAPLAVEIIRGVLEELQVDRVVAQMPGNYPSPLERMTLQMAGCFDLKSAAATGGNYVLELGFSSWKGFLASLRRSARADVLRKSRRFEERGGQVELLASGGSRDGAEVSGTSRRGGEGRLSRPLQQDFVEGGLLFGWSDLPEQAAESAARRNELEVRALEASLNGEVCGRMLLLHDRQRQCVHFRRIQLDRRMAHEVFTFFNLLFAGLKFAVMVGASLVDMGPGGGGPKARLGARLVPAMRCELRRGAAPATTARFGLGALWGGRSPEDLLHEECVLFYSALQVQDRSNTPGNSDGAKAGEASAPAPPRPPGGPPSRRAATRTARLFCRRRRRLARRLAAAETAEDFALADASDVFPASSRKEPQRGSGPGDG